MSGYPRWEVLSYDHPAEREKWRELYHRFPPGAIDVFYLPEWAYLFELHGDGRALCFVYYETPDRFVIYPFHLRFIRDIPEFRDVDPEWTDIINPYGYGGYLASQPGMDMSGFFRAWRDYCRERQVVSELVRFHPLLGNFDYCRPFIPAFRQSPVVVMDLTQGPEAIWKGMSPSCRNKIRKAQKHGVKILVDETGEHLDTFYRLYIDTMQRVGARDYYYFSRPWFDHLLNLFQGRAVLVHALLRDRIIASSLFVLEPDFVHYFFSCSDESYKSHAPNNLILYRAAMFFSKNEKKYLNLGGGLKINDNLLKFKSNFSNCQKDHFVGNIINDDKKYNSLHVFSYKQTSLDNFFPSYRFSKEKKHYNFNNKIILLGASGHGRVCMDYIIEQGGFVVAFFDDNIEYKNKLINGINVKGNIKQAIFEIKNNYYDYFIAIGDNKSRKLIFDDLLKETKKYPINLFHKTSTVSSDAIIGYGNFIGPMSVIKAKTRIGHANIINSGVLIGHDVEIDNFTQLSPGCILTGYTSIEEGAFLGAGAIVLPEKRIGKYAVIGAGAVVTQDIPPYCTAVGVPARVIKRHNMLS